MSHLHQDKKILNRVKRIQGQINAVEQSLADTHKSCIDVLQQVAAVRGAVNGLINQLIEAHLKEHVIKDKDAINEEELKEFLALLSRYQ